MKRNWEYSVKLGTHMTKIGINKYPGNAGEITSWTINLKGYGEELSIPKSRQCLGTSVKGLEEKNQALGQNWGYAALDSSRIFPTHNSEALPLSHASVVKGRNHLKCPNLNQEIILSWISEGRIFISLIRIRLIGDFLFNILMYFRIHNIFIRYREYMLNALVKY
jgi:hypothetical protein